MGGHARGAPARPARPRRSGNPRTHPVPGAAPVGLHHPCPICADERMMTLNYIFGEQLGQYSGRIKPPAEPEEMQNEFGEFKVCVVEVCTECGWNHMIMAYLLGDGHKRKPPRRRKTVEDIYG
ncbi:MAG: DUF5318 family protein [Propionibacteriaceae bacterium]|nr:DUF5318 family protein [Propionibacteriaceae bacterium]